MTKRDLLYAARAKRAGARHTIKTVEEARKAGVPLSWAFALVEQESGFRNIFGHDVGGIHKGKRVTKRRVRSLLAHVARGGNSNGVGLTQLTFPPFIRSAAKLGGAHKPRLQLRVGFRVLRDMTNGDYDRLAWKYNGAPAYQAKIAAKQDRWHRILLGRKGQ